MDELNSREARQIARRLYLIQVLLNYRTMQGGGYLFALWPWARRSHRRREIVRDTSGYINSHPVFAAFAVGALRRRLENEPSSVPPPKPQADIAVWRESLAGPLGMTGDALIWDRWKPVVFAAGTWLMLVLQSVTAWIIVAAACILVYNVPLYLLRVWGVRRGYALGERVLEAIRDARFALWRRRLTAAGVFIAGALAGTAMYTSTQENAARGTQFMVALVVMLLGLRFRFSAATAAVLAMAAALVFPMISI